MKTFIVLVLILTFPVTLVAEPLRLVSDDWPPYEYRDATTGEVTGFSTELIRAVLGKLNRAVAPIPIYPWARAEREVQAGNVDGIYTLTRTAPRRTFLYFPEEPLHTDAGVLFVRRDRLPSPPITEVSDIGRLSLAMVRGYSYSPEVLAILASSDQVTEVSDESQLFSMLARGRVDAVLTYRNVGGAVVDRMALGTEIRAITEPVLFQRRYYVGFNKQAVTRQFVEQFSDQLKLLKKSPEYQHLEQKYFGKSALR